MPVLVLPRSSLLEMEMSFANSHSLYRQGQAGRTVINEACALCSLSALGVVVWSLHSLLVYTSDYILYIRLVTVNCIYSCLIRWSYTVESYYNVDYASLSIHWLLLGVICHWCTSTHTTISHVIAARRLGMYVLESHVDAGLTAGDLVPCAVCLLWIMWFNLYLCVVNDDGRAHRCGVCATSPTEDKL